MIPNNFRPWAAAVIALVGSFVPWGTFTTEVNFESTFAGLGSLALGMRHVPVVLTGWNGHAMHVPNWVPVLLLLLANGALIVGASRVLAVGAAVLGLLQLGALAVILASSETGALGPGLAVMVASAALTLYAAKNSPVPSTTAAASLPS